MALREQTFAIIFRNFPSDYNCKDIIINHLNVKNKNKTNISRTKLQRWRRAIRLINIDESKNECHVVFSSIFYWCKYSRLILANEKKLNVGIYPNYFQTIQHPTKIDLIASNCNNQLIELLNLPSNTVSYSFISDDTLYISLKTENEKELLIKIPYIGNVKILESNNNNNDNNKENKKDVDCECILELLQQCQIFQYYHNVKYWICDECNTVNKVENDGNNINTMYCMCCGAKCGDNNTFHYREMNEMMGQWNMGEPNLNKKRVRFVDQTRFYQQITSYNTNIKNDEKFNILSPLFNVLDDNKRDIPSSIMFTNTIKLHYNRTKEQMLTYFASNLTKTTSEINIIKKYGQCKAVDFGKLGQAIDGTFQWLSDKYKDLIFPLLQRFLDFRNPCCFSDEIDEYTAKIAELQEMGSKNWLLKEVIMESNNMNAAEFERNVDQKEQEYDDKGVVDIDDEDAKGPFVYELQIAPFRININEADIKTLEASDEWKELERVSFNNYVLSFAVQRNPEMFDLFKNIKNMMQNKGYLLIHKKNNEIMHRLSSLSFDEDYISYGATICDNPLIEEKFLEYYKKDTMDKHRNNDNDDDNNNDGAYFINDNDVYQHEPPKKKIKIMHHQQIEPQKQHNHNGAIQYNHNNNIAYSSNNIPTTNSNNKETIQITPSFIQSSQNKQKMHHQQIEPQKQQKNNNEAMQYNHNNNNRYNYDNIAYSSNNISTRNNNKETVQITPSFIQSPPNKKIMHHQQIAPQKQQKHNEAMQYNHNNNNQYNHNDNNWYNHNNIAYSSNISATNSNNKKTIKIRSSTIKAPPKPPPPPPPSTEEIISTHHINTKIKSESMSSSISSSTSPSSLKQNNINIPLNKIIGKKRKRPQIIDSPSTSPDITDTFSPKSFLKSSKTKPTINPTIPSPLKTEFESFPNLTIQNGIGISFDVPIYNKRYYDCCNFEIGDNFPLQQFASLAIDLVCKSDLKIMRDLRRTNRSNIMRRREILKPDEAEPQFLKGVPDQKYRELFCECFTRNDEEKMDIDLNDYLSKTKKRMRDKRPLVIFDDYGPPPFGIKESMKERLLLLMMLYQKDITVGVLDRNDMIPPWHDMDDMSIINGLNELKGCLNAIDLTMVDTDDDETDDDDVDMMEDNVMERKEVRVKEEFGFDGEYDSEMEWE